MATKLNPSKTGGGLPDSKRVTVSNGDVKVTADRTQKLPLKTG